MNCNVLLAGILCPHLLWFPGIFSMAAIVDHRRVLTGVISPIQMERVVANFRWHENLRQGLVQAGAASELLAHIVMVVPGPTLESYRFAFVGTEVSDRLGRDISGQSFSDILRFAEVLRPCLQQFEKAITTVEKVVSRHRYDFSDKWVIEYSRVIYPVTAEDGSICAIGHYLFHEQVLEGRYF